MAFSLGQTQEVFEFGGGTWRLQATTRILSCDHSQDCEVVSRCAPEAHRNDRCDFLRLASPRGDRLGRIHDSDGCGDRNKSYRYAPDLFHRGDRCDFLSLASPRGDRLGSTLFEGFAPSALSDALVSSPCSAVQQRKMVVFGDLRCQQAHLDATECSTIAPSEVSSEMISEGETGSGSEESLLDEPVRSRVIVFDWDDTLFPSTFVALLKADELKTYAARLRAHALLVETVLRAARQLGHVAIVTLAKRPWVTKSAARFLPGLDFEALVRELGIKIYFAREQTVLGGARPTTESEWVLLKRNAMAEALCEASEETGSARQRLDAFSIGDSRIERQALRNLFGAWARSGSLAHPPICKTLKFMDKPLLSQLDLELSELLRCIRGIALCDEDFDFAVSSPGDFRDDMVHRFMQ